MENTFQNLSLGGNSHPRKLIVAIDFGTTYSGLAWAETTHPDYQNVIHHWPNSLQEWTTSPKVPTELRDTYTRWQWGFQIPNTAKKIKYFKLNLEIGVTTDGFSTENLTERYMKHMHAHLMYMLNSRLTSSVVKSTPIDYILTVPAIWSEAAKHKTLTAAENAGFRPINPTNVVTEPVGQLSYSIRRNSLSKLGIGNSVTVCDARGGTVDLISYTVVQVHPRLDSMEATAGTGAMCGSSMLNKNFQSHLKSHFGNDYWTDERLTEANEDFELFKKTFKPSGEPLTLRVEMDTNVELGVRRNRYTMSQEEMQSRIFEPIIQDIINLVKEQLSSISTGVSAILMVGGFGQSEYLKNRVQAAVSSSIYVLQPADGWTAVVRGAAMMGISRASGGLGTVGVVSRIARKHYGVELMTLFEHSRHDSRIAWWEKDWQRYVVNAMTWFINKGNSIQENQTCKIDFHVYADIQEGVKVQKCTIFANDGDSTAPIHRNSNTTVLVNLSFDLDYLPHSELIKCEIKRHANGRLYYDVQGFVEARYGSAITTYTLNLNSEQGSNSLIDAGLRVMCRKNSRYHNRRTVDYK
ncbi:hypothetical protein BU16DRAFT_606211 [Lophium mytilinum]|uniref:Actin-like ATPase domain-containing protein n=1 Tax=Lophium mytilinum TaxID=390894 RepID=A0A6A6R129_9PEZI|nr:hypothetical protein BU16DRAFT_606211 [Lophium mytilinum]